MVGKAINTRDTRDNALFACEKSVKTVNYLYMHVKISFVDIRFYSNVSQFSCIC